MRPCREVVQADQVANVLGVAAAGRSMKDWLSPLDVAILTGFSAAFIRAELRAGEIPAVQVTSPTRPRKFARWRIARHDAVAYAKRMGVTVAPAVTGETPIAES